MTKNDLINEIAKCRVKNEELKKSRDELLQELDGIVGFVLNNWNARGQKIIKVIRKAEGIKEKETK